MGGFIGAIDERASFWCNPPLPGFPYLGGFIGAIDERASFWRNPLLPECSPIPSCRNATFIKNDKFSIEADHRRVNQRQNCLGRELPGKTMA